MTNLLSAHWFAVVCVVAYIIKACVSAMPDTKADFDWYTWLNHVLKSLLNDIPAKYQPKGDASWQGVDWRALAGVKQPTPAPPPPAIGGSGPQP